VSIEARLQSLDGRSMVFAEGIVQSDGTLEDGMIEIDFKLSTTGEEVVVEELVSAGSVFRLPRAGELALIGFVDGDRNEGYVVGWIARPENSPAPSSVVSGVVYLYARDGEDIRIRTDGRVTVEADEILLGGDGALSYVALATKVDILWAKLYGVFTAWIPTSGDGIALKTAWTIAFPSVPDSVGSDKVRSE
jgi:hypothetical protein